MLNHESAFSENWVLGPIISPVLSSLSSLQASIIARLPHLRARSPSAFITRPAAVGAHKTARAACVAGFTRPLAVHAQQPAVTISLSAWGPAHACEEPLRFFDLWNFGPRVEAYEGGNEQFAGDLIPTGRLIELCK
jgi:hypothetical protein